MTKNDFEKYGIEIYRTTQKDFDILTDISKVCYPHQMRWKAPKSFGRKWWNILINSDFCEVWTCVCEGKIIAYGTLIFDRLKYEETWQNVKPGFGSKLYIIVTCPDVIITRLIKQFRRCFVKHFGKKNRPFNNNAIQKEKMEKLFLQKVSWLGPAAVVPSMQGRGVATKICQFCADRAAELGYKEMWSYLRKNNFKSKGLITKIGFVVVDEINHLLFIRKTLNSDETQNC